jgi:hypothetical protein
MDAVTYRLTQYDLGGRCACKIPPGTTGVPYCENSPHGSDLTTGLGRELADTDEAVAEATPRQCFSDTFTWR